MIYREMSIAYFFFFYKNHFIEVIILSAIKKIDFHESGFYKNIVVLWHVCTYIPVRTYMPRFLDLVPGSVTTDIR